jgi:hypothetical protein
MLGILIIMASCAGSSVYMKPSQSLLNPTSEKALVRFMRPSGMGYAVNFNIWDGEKVIGNSVAKGQFDYLADPGKHLFVAVAENQAFVEANLEAGNIYYIITQVKMGVWKARVGFIPVNKGSEFWDKVKEYENELDKLEPNTEALRSWELANKSGMQDILNRYETEWKSKGWPKLNPEDGR